MKAKMRLEKKANGFSIIFFDCDQEMIEKAKTLGYKQEQKTTMFIDGLDTPEKVNAARTPFAADYKAGNIVADNTNRFK